MPKMALVFLFFSSTFSCLGGPSIEGHGLGFLQRVRNTSAYPISFAQSKTILDYLPDGTVIRIKSLRREYGVAGRYYAARRIVGAYRLEADTFDPNDLATHFVVKRFVARDFSEYIGIYSDSAEGQFMKSDSSRAVTFSMPDMMDEKLAEGHWSIISASGDSGPLDSKKFLDPNFAANVFNNCYLKSRTSGVMQSRGKPQNYPGTNAAPINKSANSILMGTESSTGSKENESGEFTVQNAQSEKKPEPLKLDSKGNEIPKSYSTAQGIPTTIYKEKSIAVGNSNAIVAINKNGQPFRKKTDESWESIDQGLNGASLVSLGAAEDGTMWACDQNNNVWAYQAEKNIWNKVLLAPSTGVITKVVLASATQIWVLSKDGTIFQKSGPDTNTIWQPPSPQVGTGVVKDFCISSDGTIFAICSDNKIYKGTSSGSSYTFSQFSAPQDLFNAPPYRITAGSQSFVAFTTPADEVYVLVTGKSGGSADSWKKLTIQAKTTPIKLRNLSANKNNSLVGIVSSSGQPEDNTVILVSDITTA